MQSESEELDELEENDNCDARRGLLSGKRNEAWLLVEDSSSGM